MNTLPRFNEEQQQFVVDCLIASVPHKDIADQFRDLYPEFGTDLE